MARSAEMTKIFWTPTCLFFFKNAYAVEYIYLRLILGIFKHIPLKVHILWQDDLEKTCHIYHPKI